MKDNTITRTDAVDKMKNSKGRFFTVSWIANDEQPRTYNGNCGKECETALGYININTKGGIKNVNPKTITGIQIGGTKYGIRK
tara:strand:- start:37853 stop:38101 length:249 start_codon:yes stop_codon:yes gene_type:complete